MCSRASPPFPAPPSHRIRSGCHTQAPASHHCSIIRRPTASSNALHTTCNHHFNETTLSFSSSLCRTSKCGEVGARVGERRHFRYGELKDSRASHRRQRHDRIRRNLPAVGRDSAEVGQIRRRGSDHERHSQRGKLRFGRVRGRGCFRRRPATW